MSDLFQARLYPNKNCTGPAWFSNSLPAVGTDPNRG